jgi:hypothetical protein
MVRADLPEAESPDFGEVGEGGAAPKSSLAPMSRAGGAPSSDENGVIDHKMLWFRPIHTSVIV